MKLKLLSTSLIVLILSLASSASAEGVNYIDESGTIHFANSAADVPARYRSQVIRPTPGPQTEKEYREKLAEYKRQKAIEEREKKQALREAEKERQRQQKLRDAELKLRKKELDKETKRKLREQEKLSLRSSKDSEDNN